MKKLSTLGLMLVLAVTAMAKGNKQPNILMIWGDDIGQSNISAYTKGMVGYTTPNIDRIANEGVIFTDYYGEQSCTAGRSTFITGQSVLRTGLSKVGLPGSDKGISPLDPTVADYMKEKGYTTGQFGKNHFGDRDHMLPTAHGFDEFLGNLYHLNAEEEPELRDYPKDPAFAKKFGPRGVIHSYADGRIEDTGALTKKRMETVDYETVEAAIRFMKEAQKKDVPFFVWWNGTRMHFRTHVKEELMNDPKYANLNEYQIGMIEHDMNVGTLLAAIDEMGIADETMILYTTDNGPHKNTWPDAANSPFRSEKNTNWEGGWRVPAVAKWPGVIEAGSVSNEVMHHMDWFQTIAAYLGDTDIDEQLKKGTKLNGKDFKVHLDGYNFLPYFEGKEDRGPRNEIFYFSDDGDLTAMRQGDFKYVFMEQREVGTAALWANPFTRLRVPLIFNLRQDPYEEANITSNTYYDYLTDHFFLMVPAQVEVGKFLSTFRDFPPRMKAASFSVDQVLENMQKQAENAKK